MDAFTLIKGIAPKIYLSLINMLWNQTRDMNPKENYWVQCYHINSSTYTQKLDDVREFVVTPT